MKKTNKKGFTLIELLAVIIILGVLLLIAVPSISKYITQSKINTYESNLLKMVDAVRTEVNSGNYSFSTNEYLVVPLHCIELEKGNNTKSPFGNYVQIYSGIVVTRKNNSTGFNYYIGLFDDSKYGVNLSNVESDDFKVTTNISVYPNHSHSNPSRFKVQGIDRCKTESCKSFEIEVDLKTAKIVRCS